jgi:hypothetical protein
VIGLSVYSGSRAEHEGPWYSRLKRARQSFASASLGKTTAPIHILLGCRQCKGLQDTHITWTMQQDAALTCLDGAPATMAEQI